MVTSGGTSGVVESGVDVAIGVVSVDSEEGREGDGLGSPQSLSNSDWFTNRSDFGDAVNFDVDVNDGGLSSGPGALDSGSSISIGVLGNNATKVLDVQSWIHFRIGGLSSENGGGRVEGESSNGGIHSLHPNVVGGRWEQSGSDGDGERSLWGQDASDGGGSRELVVDTENIVVGGSIGVKSDADILDVIGAHIGWGRGSRGSGNGLGRGQG